jgi:hypothetical protein
LLLKAGEPRPDGHSDAAEQIAVAARDSGIEVADEGIRLTQDKVSRNAQKQRHGSGHGQHPVVLQAAEWLTKLLARDRLGLVDHDLRRPS